MQPSERLAALVAGELSTDERRALAAELARDPDLRAQLAAMERADAVLAAETRTELSDGAEDRLLAALAPSLDAELGAADEAGDELAARRAGRGGRRTWLTAAGGVAAAIAAVAVVLPNLAGSGDDSSGTAEVAMEAGEDVATMDADDAGGAMPGGPTVTGGERELDAGGADALLTAPELEAIAGAGLEVEAATGLGADWAVRLGAPLAAAADDGRSTFDEVETESADDAAAGDAAAQTEEAPAEGAEADAVDRAGAGEGALVGPGVGADDLVDVGRCLETLLATGDVAVPVTAELVVFDGEPAITFGLVSQDADGDVRRREVWVLDRASCEVRYFTQG